VKAYPYKLSIIVLKFAHYKKYYFLQAAFQDKNAINGKQIYTPDSSRTVRAFHFIQNQIYLNNRKHSKTQEILELFSNHGVSL